MSFVYIYSEPVGLYAVGHYSPDGAFVAESGHRSEDEAAVRCRWLNGSGDENRAAASTGFPGTLRDWFAGHALRGILEFPSRGGQYSPKDAASLAYEMADAMIAESAKTK